MRVNQRTGEGEEWGWNTEEVREKARRREACDAGCETNGTIATGVVEIKRSRRSAPLCSSPRGLTEGMGRSGMKKREERGKEKKKNQPRSLDRPERSTSENDTVLLHRWFKSVDCPFLPGYSFVVNVNVSE